MVIELCGIPGGGKSTLMRAYLAAYPETKAVSLDMYNKLPTAWYAGLFFLSHPISSLFLLRYVQKFHTRSLFWYSLHLTLRACAKWQMAVFTGRNKRPSFVDEGLLHLLSVMPGKMVSEQEFSRMVKILPHPRAVVFSEKGNFHRFHNSEAYKHPRVQQGTDALGLWESAVRLNTATLRSCLVRIGIPAFVIPEEVDASKALRAFIETL